jgi:uncharacterized protein DUF4245
MSHERLGGVGVGGRPGGGHPAVGAAGGMGDDREVAADKRGNKTIVDLALSLVVLGFVVFVIYLFIPHDSNADPVQVVPFGVELGQARRTAPYPVVGPEGLGAGWRSTSVTFSAADSKNTTWHVGFVDPQQQYVAIEQSNGPADAFISSVTLHSHPDAGRTVQAGGLTWQRYTGGRYTALVRKQPGCTTVVLGTAPDSRLTQMAAALK